MLRTFPLLVLCAGLLAWAGCDALSSNNAREDSPTTGRIQVYLTDAPGDIAEAHVTVERVELVPADEDGGGILVLSDSTRRLDLLTLQDGVTETLADTALPAGTYSQIRLVVANDAEIVLEDGSTPRLKIPSGEQTGIKVVVPDFTIEDDEDVVSLTLDFSVEDSFVKAGRSGMYLFKPTVRAQAMDVDGPAIEFFELEGAVSAVDAGTRLLEVDGIPIGVPEEAELEGADDETLALEDFEDGTFVEVEGTQYEDGTLAAHEVERQDDDEAEREVEAVLDAVDPDAGTFAVLGATFEINEDTSFDDVDRLADLQAGDRVEITYDVVDGTRLALEVEREAAAWHP